MTSLKPLSHIIKESIVLPEMPVHAPSDVAHPEMAPAQPVQAMSMVSNLEDQERAIDEDHKRDQQKLNDEIQSVKDNAIVNEDEIEKCLDDENIQVRIATLESVAESWGIDTSAAGSINLVGAKSYLRNLSQVLLEHIR